MHRDHTVILTIPRHLIDCAKPQKQAMQLFSKGKPIIAIDLIVEMEHPIV